MPPAIGYWDVTSPKVRTTRNCPATTIGIVQMNAGPAVARPKAERVHANDGREVREPEREVAPEPERSGQLLPVSERGKLRRIRPDLFSLHSTSFRVCGDAGRWRDAITPTNRAQGGIIDGCVEGVSAALPSR